MTDLSLLTDEQLVTRYRQLVDKAESLRKKMQPYFDEMEKIKTEFELIDSELVNRKKITVNDNE